MRVVAIVQARMGSTRLPGKVLSDICGRPMIARVVERVRRISGVDSVAVAIPDLPEDRPLSDVLETLGVPVVNGPSENVLARYLGASQATSADAVVRITADCPLLSPKVSSRVVGVFRTESCDYASNTLTRTYPRGLDTEVVGVDVLRRAAQQATEPDREHVTSFIWRHPDRFRLCSVRQDADFSQHRWTVDTEDDLRFVRAVYDALGSRADEADQDDILGLLQERPYLLELNQHVAQKPFGV